MIQIDLAPSGRLRLHFEDGHTTTLPFTRAGFVCLHRILQARVAGAAPLISTPTSPTQWDLDQWLRTHTIQTTRTKLNLSIPGVDL